MRDYFQTLMQRQDDFPLLKEIIGIGIDKNQVVKNLFTPQDILDAVQKANFTKRLGADEFSGEIFK